LKHESLSSNNSPEINVERGKQGAVVRLLDRLGINSSPDLRE
jgi:hypothetical protein